jgi:hypothetical protein
LPARAPLAAKTLIGVLPSKIHSPQFQHLESWGIGRGRGQVQPPKPPCLQFQPFRSLPLPRARFRGDGVRCTMHAVASSVQGCPVRQSTLYIMNINFWAHSVKVDSFQFSFSARLLPKRFVVLINIFGFHPEWFIFRCLAAAYRIIPYLKLPSSRCENGPEVSYPLARAQIQ